MECVEVKSVQKQAQGNISYPHFLPAGTVHVCAGTDLSHSGIEFDWENNGHEGVRDLYDRITSRYLLYCHVHHIWPPLYFPVPKAIRKKSSNSYFNVRCNFCLYFGIKSVVYCQ